MRNILKKILSVLLCVCLMITAASAGWMNRTGILKAEAATETDYDFSYEDLFFKAPSYLLRSNAAEHITGLCTNAQADGIQEISASDTATATMLEAMANGTSWIFNEIFGITTSSMAEKMEDELLLEMVRDFADTKDSYLCISEEVVSDYQKCFDKYLDNLADMSKASLVECLKKANHSLSESNIEKIVDAYYKQSDKILKGLSTAADMTETLITMVSLQEIELALIDDLIALQPKNSDLTAPLSRFRYDMTSNIGEYFTTHYLVDEVISYIGKTVSRGIWKATGTGSVAVTIATVTINVIKMIYEIGHPSVSDIVLANRSYSWTKIMEEAVSDLQMDFIKNPRDVGETTINELETAYSFYLTIMRVGMKKIAKATGKSEANRLNTFIDLLGDGALTYESYIQGCMNALQNDIDRGIFVMPKETVKESMESGKPAVGTIIQYSARLAEPSTTDYHYYNVAGCQNPYAKTAGLGIPNCTTYAWGRAWELAGNDWLKYGSNFHENANTFWSINEANHYFPSGQTPAVGALAVYGATGTNSAGHIAVVENTDEIWQDGNGKYCGYYISHSSYGGFSWSSNTGNGTRNFHYDKVTDASFESGTLGPLLGFIYVYSGQGYDDSVNFVVDENGVLTKYNGWQSNVTIPDGVTAIGNNAFYNNKTMQSVVIPDSVTSIGDSAFKRCTNLRYITIPDNVTTIGDSAFEGCTSLASVTLPINAEFHEIKYATFRECKSLGRIAIPNSVTEIGDYAFSECSALASVTLSKSLVSLGREVFYNCDNLTAVEIPKTLEFCGNDHYSDGYNLGPFRDCDNLKFITFEQGITKIAKRLFYQCTGLEQIKIPDTITTIDPYAFYNCINLRNIEIPDNVTDIGDYAFRYCYNLASVKLPKNLAILGYACFGDCDSLTAIEIPKSLDSCCYSDYWGPFMDCDNLKNITFEKGITKIAENTFLGCTGLESIEIPDTVTTIEYSAFRNCTNLKSIQIPDNVTEIGNHAFSKCSALASVTLSKSLAKLGGSAFYGCDSLTAIEIPKSLESCDITGFYGPFTNCENFKNVSFEKGVTEIADNLFCYCTGLEQIEIPDTVTVIEYSAFQCCTALTRVILHEGELKEIDDSAFSRCTSLPEIIIPNSVTDMGTHIFSGCTSLKKVVLPHSRQELPYSTFQDCTSLSDITLPDSLTAIRMNAFRNCDALASITIPKNVTVIENNAFYHCDALTAVTIPEKITSIGSSAFYDCDALTAVTLSDSVASIGSSCFESCDMLSKVTLSTALKAIPSKAFMDCAALQELVLPYGVTSIGSNAFKNDTVLTKITIPKSVTSIDSTAFSYPKKLTISGVAGSYAETFATEKGIAFNPINIPASSLALSESSLNLYPNKTADLQAIVKPLDYTGDVVWSSSDSEIVSVTENGRITAHKSGTATITAAAGEKTASCTVTVLVPVSQITLDKTDLTIALDSTYQLKPLIEPENASNKKLLYSSSDESVATVDVAGLITPHKAGNVRITIQSEDGYTRKTCYITVAEKADVPSFVLGDVDHNNFITTDDALCVLKHAVGIQQTGFDVSLADYDKDGKVTTDDALSILKYAVGQS